MVGGSSRPRSTRPLQREVSHMQSNAADVVLSNTTGLPLCLFCGHCGYHGWCPSGLFVGPALEGCIHAAAPSRWCTQVSSAADILRGGLRKARGG